MQVERQNGRLIVTFKEGFEAQKLIKLRKALESYWDACVCLTFSHTPPEIKVSNSNDGPLGAYETPERLRTWISGYLAGLDNG